MIYMEKITSNQISVVVSPWEIAQILEYINNGYALNRSDFARQAIREKLARDEKAVVF